VRWGARVLLIHMCTLYRGTLCSLILSVQLLTTWTWTNKYDMVGIFVRIIIPSVALIPALHRTGLTLGIWRIWRKELNPLYEEKTTKCSLSLPCEQVRLEGPSWECSQHQQRPLPEPPPQPREGN
jgi:hypothetical protein